MNERTQPSTTRIVLWMGLFVVLGAPFVFMIWEFLNNALAGDFAASELVLAVIGAVGLMGVLRFVASRAHRWNQD